MPKDNRKIYEVEITKVFQTSVYVRADSAEEAEDWVNFDTGAFDLEEVELSVVRGMVLDPEEEENGKVYGEKVWDAREE